MRYPLVEVNKTLKNQGTRIALFEPARVSPEVFAEAFAKGFDRLTALLAAGDPGFVVMGYSPGMEHAAVRQIKLGRDSAIEPVVVGRHECADLMLASDEALSLRHSLVLLRVDAEGRPLTRVLDLRSGTGMADAVGRLHYSIAADGPVCLSLAGSALFVIPSGSKPPLGAGPRAAFDAIAWPSPVPWIPERSVEQRLSELSREPGSSSVVSVVIGGTGAGKPVIRRRGGRRAGRLKLDFGGQSYEHQVDTYALRAGVLVGRYDRCDLSPITVEMPDVVSRVHLLLISIEERTHIFDTGSTNGLTYEGFSVRGMALPDSHPATFELADDVSMTWWPG
jgi:hypothetical protein